MDLAAILISGTAIGLVIALPMAVRRAGAGTLQVAIAAAVPAIMMLLSAVLAAGGVLSRFDRLPPPGMLFLATCIIATVGMAMSPIGRALGQGIPMAWLIGFQSFRLLAELAIEAAHRQGLAPLQMTWHGRNLDIITALTAIPVALMIHRRPSRALAIGWNLLGLGLLLNVMAVGILSLPAPWQRFWPSNIWATWSPTSGCP